MPRQPDTRERLIDAAIAVLESEGEVAIRVNDLAESVDVRKPSVYHFFGGREGLVVAALAEMYRRSLLFGAADLTPVLEASQTREQFIEGFFAVVDSLWDESGTRRRAARMEVLGAAVGRPALQSALVEMHQQHTRALAEFYEAAQKRGFIRSSFDPQMLALWSLSAVLGRHFVEIDPTCDGAEWDAITREALRHLVFDEIERS